MAPICPGSKCHCKDGSNLKISNPRKVIDTSNGISITEAQISKMEEDIALGIPVDVAAIKQEKERKKVESQKRIEEFRGLDEKFGRNKEETSHMRSMSEDIAIAKRQFYNERASAVKLRVCQDFTDMNSFVYKAKSQAIRDNQIALTEVIKRDAEELVKREISARYKTIEEDYERETKERAELHKINDMHLKSLKAMIVEKEVANELRRLRYQQAAMIRNNHTAYRLKKRMEYMAKQQQENKKVRALQMGVYENRQQMENILNAEAKMKEEKDREFYELKNQFIKKYNEERDAERQKRDEHLKKCSDEAAQRNFSEGAQQEIAYIRDKDAADKKWRMQMEEKERKRMQYRQQLWDEQEKTKKDILDHICLATERDRMDFERIVRENEEDWLREQEVEKEKRKKMDEVRRDLQCTINEKLDKQREERELTMENAKNQVLNNKLYLKYHDREMFRELERLRKEGLEEKYISETARHSNVTPGQVLKPSVI